MATRTKVPARQPELETTKPYMHTNNYNTTVWHFTLSGFRCWRWDSHLANTSNVSTLVDRNLHILIEHPGPDGDRDIVHIFMQKSIIQAGDTRLTSLTICSMWTRRSVCCTWSILLNPDSIPGPVPNPISTSITKICNVRVNRCMCNLKCNYDIVFTGLPFMTIMQQHKHMQ